MYGYLYVKAPFLYLLRVLFDICLLYVILTLLLMQLQPIVLLMELILHLFHLYQPYICLYNIILTLPEFKICFYIFCWINWNDFIINFKDLHLLILTFFLNHCLYIHQLHQHRCDHCCTKHILLLMQVVQI